MMASEKLAILRSVLLGLTGLTCVLYALLAALQDRPDPMAWWIPGGFGVLVAVVISLSFFGAGAQASGEATDELHRATNHRAQRHAYWVSLALFVAVTVANGHGLIAADTGFAVLGTSMGAAYLLLFVFYEWRMC